MYGDTTVIRHLAARLRDQADDIRHHAERLVGEADATIWRGQAADAMRASVRRHAAALRHTAELHDEAAAALLRHARQVEETKALIAAVERAVGDLVGAARDRLSAVAGGIADAVGLGEAGDRVLAGFAAPPAGSLAWLRVELPDLTR